MRRCDRNLILTLVHSCKRDLRQHSKHDFANLLLKLPEKRRRYCMTKETLLLSIYFEVTKP